MSWEEMMRRWIRMKWLVALSLQVIQQPLKLGPTFA